MNRGVVLNGNMFEPDSSNLTTNRVLLVEELYRRYGRDEGRSRLAYRIRFLQKKYSWTFVVGFANFLKRSIDVIGASFLLLALSPLLVIVAIAVKSTGGP